MLWQPINLTEVCPANTNITACSHFGYVYLNLLVQLFGDSVDRRIQEKLHRDDDDVVKNIHRYGEEEVETCDFIVVGAGSAGCVVANRLSAISNWTVCIFEAGSEQPEVASVPGLSTALIGSSIDWGYTTEPNGKSCLARPGGRCGWPRGKVMGGSSTINSLAYIRGNKLDYDNWAAMGNEGWSYDEVLPFFKKSEKNLNLRSLDRNYHSDVGEQSVSWNVYVDKPSIMITEAFHQIGLPIRDYNAAHQEATMQAQSFVQDGQRVSTYTSFIEPVRYKRPNLIVRPGSEVFKILIEDGVAYGVKYNRSGKVCIAHARKEVIVSGGTINSPKLLMLSGIGPRKHLSALNINVKQDLPVGKYLQDHPSFNGLPIVLPKNTATNVSQEQVLREIIEYKQMISKKGPLAASGPDATVTFFRTDPHLPAPDIQCQVGAMSSIDEYVREPEVFDSLRIFPASFYDCLVARTQLLVPKSRGMVLLNSSNPYGPPILHANYLGEPTDILQLLKGVRIFLKLENTEAFKSRGAYFLKTPLKACRHLAWGSDEYILCLARSYTSATHHQAGTCRMGPKNDGTAVVDPRLRVYGISGLRVIDASIMPNVTRGNTNAPSIMIGEKGVAMVIEDWLKKYNNHHNANCYE